MTLVVLDSSHFIFGHSFIPLNQPNINNIPNTKTKGQPKMSLVNLPMQTKTPGSRVQGFLSLSSPTLTPAQLFLPQQNSLQ
jgi:hypothetical protein